MSVLLDALKKAALEKQKRDQGLAGKASDRAIPRDSDSDANAEGGIDSKTKEENASSDAPELAENFDTELSLEQNAGASRDESDERLEMLVEIDEAHFEALDDSVPTLEEPLEEHSFESDEEIEDFSELCDVEGGEIDASSTGFEGELSEELKGAPDVAALNNHQSLEEVDTQAEKPPLNEVDSKEFTDDVIVQEQASLKNSELSTHDEHVQPSSRDRPSVEGDEIPHSPQQKNQGSPNDPPQASAEHSSQTIATNSETAARDGADKKTFVSEDRHSAEYFKQLLRSNQEDIKRRRKKFLVWFVVCITIAIATACSYYYYSIVNYQPPINVNPITDNLEDSDAPEIDASSDDAAVVINEAQDEPSQRPDPSSHANASVISENTPIAPPARTAKISTSPTPTPKARVAKKKTVPTQNAASRAPIKQRIEVSEPKVDPLSLAINQGYMAYNRGEFQEAEDAYNRALSISPRSRDAILGAAAVASVNGQLEKALVLYQRQLSQKPNDDYAHSGMLSILSVESISPELFSKVNELLGKFPEAAHLHFLKGRMLVKQSRWSAAQMSFFNAWTRSSDRADYAYNLAISLDNLGLPEEALIFYKRSLELARNNMYGVDIIAVRKRIEILEGAKNE